ncbi:MAG: cyclase family protein, partial [Pseudomonadota bacterium]
LERDEILAYENYLSQACKGQAITESTSLLVNSDVPRLLGAPGEWDIFGPSVLDTDRLMRCLDAINVSVRPGDVLLFRFGWMHALTHFADESARREWFDKGVFAGLSGGQSMWEFLWDHGVAAAASDSPTLEATPMPKGDNLHLAIPCLGFTIGEFFALEALAEACAEDGIYTVFLTTSPLNLRGGVGSPPNAIAIK